MIVDEYSSSQFNSTPVSRSKLSTFAQMCIMLAIFTVCKVRIFLFDCCSSLSVKHNINVIYCCIFYSNIRNNCCIPI